MNTLYFDCSGGISGDMTLGALTEILGDESYLPRELGKLHLPGWDLKYSKVKRNGITLTHADVRVEEHHDDHEQHEHPHRSFSDIKKIIMESDLEELVKDLSIRIFSRVAKAESKIHDVPIEEVTFHEVGAVDSIIDIVGTAILICKLNPKRVTSSVVCDGHGFINCAHGRIPVPVPATMEIFAEAGVKLQQMDVDTELVTPTGAAIIAELASEFGTMPFMSMEKVGYGAGTKVIEGLTGLRVVAGEMQEKGYEDMGFAKIDSARGKRTGHQEVVFCEGKPDEYLVKIFKEIYEKNGEVLGTRASAHQYELVKNVLPEVTFDEVSHILKIEKEKNRIGKIAICTGGTADISVAEEAAQTAEFMGSKVERIYDVGVAGIHRLFGEQERLKDASVVIAVAGMEGALPSVVAGLVSVPVIGVPTSIGYGTGADGYAALLGMLNSCANGVSVVNIDNGYGAAYIADSINKGAKR